MSTCMRCDRCRKTYDRGGKGISGEFPGFADNDFDLCGNCAKEFRKFMAAKRWIGKDKK